MCFLFTVERVINDVHCTIFIVDIVLNPVPTWHIFDDIRRCQPNIKNHAVSIIIILRTHIVLL